MSKVINYGTSSQDKIIEGVKKAADAIKVSMGPAGKCVAISDGILGETVTRDGITIAKSISFKDAELNMGAQLLRKASDNCNNQAGDGTSTCSVLIKELVEKGRKAVNTGSNVNEIKSGMLKAGKWVTNYIKSKSIKIDGDLEKIRKVATISANNDPEVGDLVVKCMEQVGINGVITADISSGLETVVDITPGMKLDRGWSSPGYVTQQDSSTCVMEDCYVIVIGEKISSMNQIIPMLEAVINGPEAAGRPFLIICDSIDDNVNATLVMNNLRGACRTCVVQGLDFGDARKNLMADIAVACGGKFICAENGIDLADFTIEFCGAAKKVIVSRDNTIIFEGAGDPGQIEERVNILNSRLSDPNISNYDRSKFERRIANLSGGIAVIKSGGATEAEKVNRKQTLEDSILASKSALAEGCVPGCGYVYLKAAKELEKDGKFLKSLIGDEIEGAKIIISSLPIIMKTVVNNCGESSDIVLNTVYRSGKENYGYNAKTKKFCNLVDDGVLDSARVIRCALENAISTASMILLIDCTVIEEAEEEAGSERR